MIPLPSRQVQDTRTLRYKSILEEMTKFKQLHHLVGYVARENSKIYSSPSYQSVVDTMVEGAGLVKRQVCLDYYMTKYHVDKPEAKRVLAAAIKKEYVVHHTFGTSIDTLSVTPWEGDNFLKRLLWFRLGMYNDMFAQYQPINPIISTAASVTSTIISMLALTIAIIALYKH